MKSTPQERSRVFVVSVAMITLVFGSLSSHCKEIEEATCDVNLRASIDSLNAASLDFIAAAEDLKLEVATACHAIATDLEVADLPQVSAEMTDEEVQEVCGLAQAAIQAEIDAGVTVEVVVEGGYCEVDAQAQFDCEAECTVEGECDPGSIEVRCDPGELSVQCDAACDVNAYCQGSADVVANCEGSCSGGCFGTCEGNPVEGAYCEGYCSGECSGECYIEVEGGIECGADVRCRGGCTGTATAPHCEGEITPPDCDIEADCQAGCEGQASFEAECVPPTVSVEVVGDAHANLQSTLVANMPSIMNAVRYKGELLLDAAGNVVNSATNVAGDLADSAVCAAAVGLEVAGNLAAVAEASASVTVTVEVSVDVSASCGVQ